MITHEQTARLSLDSDGPTKVGAPRPDVLGLGREQMLVSTTLCFVDEWLMTPTQRDSVPPPIQGTRT